jgi:Cu-Zn family superoxide dismutase
MRMKFRDSLAVLACLIVLVTAVQAPASDQTAHAALKDAQGRDVGTADLIQTAAGVLFKLVVKNMPPGVHAVHVHGTGKCEPPFDSAGGHFNPGDDKHGLLAAEGPHAGDMPNMHVPESGDVSVEILNAAITLEKDKPNSVFRPNGAAIVIHAGLDDYRSDPAGNAGGRIVCGVIQPGP